MQETDSKHQIATNTAYANAFWSLGVLQTFIFWCKSIFFLMLSQILQNAINTLQHEGSGPLDFFDANIFSFWWSAGFFLMQIIFSWYVTQTSPHLSQLSFSRNPPTPLWRWRRAYWGAIGYTKCSSHICLYSSLYISFSWGGGHLKISHRNRSPAGVFVIVRTFFGVWIWRGYWDGILGRFGGILGLKKRRNRNKILCIGTF